MDFSRKDTKVVKGFAIVLMLYHHLFAFPNRIQGENSYTPLFTFDTADSAMLVGLFGRVCVALFLFLGGYGTWMSYRVKTMASLPDAFKEEEMIKYRYDFLSCFIIDKIKRLYAPFLKVFIIVVPLAVMLNDPQVQISFTSLFWNATGFNISYNGEWWFFTDYVILLAAFPLMVRFFNRKNAAASVDLLVICIWNGVVTWVIPSIAQMSWMDGFSESLLWRKLYQTMQWSSCFVVGCLFARWDLLSRVKEKLSGRHLACLGALVLVPFLVCLRFKLNVGYRYDFIFAPAICIALSMLAATRAGAFVARPLAAIGRQSTGIWLTHSFFCYHWFQSFIYLPQWSPLVFLLLLGVSSVFSLFIDIFWKIIISFKEMIEIKYHIKL